MVVQISSTTSKGTWNRTIKTSATPGEETSLGTIELCENTIVGETSFRITGDGFDNALFNITSNQNTENSNMGIFYPTSNITIGLVDDLNDAWYIYFYFPGKTTGVRENVEEIVVTIERKTEGRTVYYWGGTLPNSTLNLNITRYDDVGGVIEGTFSGTFLTRTDNEIFTDKVVTISDGKFSVLRYPDAF